MKIKSGVYYFPSKEKALAWADINYWPTDRIIEYGLGFAIQVVVSGPYAGPDHIEVLSRHHPK